MAYSHHKFELEFCKKRYFFRQENLEEIVTDFKLKYQKQIAEKDFSVLRELFYALSNLVRHCVFYNNYDKMIAFADEAFEVSSKMMSMIHSAKLKYVLEIEVANIHQTLSEALMLLKMLNDNHDEQFKLANLIYNHTSEAFFGTAFDDKSFQHRKKLMRKACDTYAHAALFNGKLKLAKLLINRLHILNTDSDGRIIDKKIQLSNLISQSYFYYHNRKHLIYENIDAYTNSYYCYKTCLEAHAFYQQLLNSTNPVEQRLAKDKTVALNRLMLDCFAYRISLLCDLGTSQNIASYFQEAIEISNWFMQNIDDRTFHDRLSRYAYLTESTAKAYLNLKHHHKALKFYIKTYNIKKQSGEINETQKRHLLHIISACNIHVGRHFATNGHISTAMKYYNDAYKVAKEFNDLRKIADACESLAELYTYERRCNLPKAKAFIMLAIKTLKEHIVNNIDKGDELLQKIKHDENYFEYYSRLRFFYRIAYFDKDSSMDEILQRVNDHKDVKAFDGCKRVLFSNGKNVLDSLPSRDESRPHTLDSRRHNNSEIFPNQHAYFSGSQTNAHTRRQTLTRHLTSVRQETDLGIHYLNDDDLGDSARTSMLKRQKK